MPALWKGTKKGLEKEDLMAAWILSVMCLVLNCDLVSYSRLETMMIVELDRGWG